MNVSRFVGKCCDASKYLASLEDGTAVVDSVSTLPNVTVTFKSDDRLVYVPFSRQDARDLLDLGVVVYIADEIESREVSEDGWNREFDCLFPVHSPDLWNLAGEDLQTLLRLLSGDEWRSEFVARKCLPRRTVHRRRIRGKWDAVCLFSGGLDSLCGAANLLQAGKRILLVGHQAEGFTASSQKRLAGVLKVQFPGQVELIQVRVARSLAKSPKFDLPDKSENSHRPRSFLFLSLACAVASALGVSEVVIPENGLIGLNIPLQTSRVGTLSTRTAHPLFIHLFNRFVNRIHAFDGLINNPFMYQSKTDVVATIPSWLVAHLRPSISCAHAGDVRWSARPGVPHCGYCIPCVYRRLALHSIGLDRTEDYISDVFTCLADLPPNKQLDLKAVVAFAKRIRGSSDVAIETMICSNGYFDPHEVSHHSPVSATSFGPWREMLTAWSSQSLATLDQVCDDATKETLGL